MSLRCWGTRGNVATPGADTIEVGGNTACYELGVAPDKSFLIDCGSGAIEYASSLMSREPGSVPKVIEHNLLISHLHWDHILGFPFFHPLHARGVRVNLYSAFPSEMLAQHMEQLFDGTYSPLRTIANLSAEVNFYHIAEEGATIAGARVTHCRVDQAGVCYAFRIELGDKAVGYVTDHEARESELNERVVELVRGVDLLLHDAQYTADEYTRHVGWGHSSFEGALQNARRAGARRLLFAHHDPTHSDAFLERCIQELDRGAGPPFELAREGSTYEF